MVSFCSLFCNKKVFQICFERLFLLCILNWNMLRKVLIFNELLQLFYFFNYFHSDVYPTLTRSLLKYSFIHSVVTDFGRSSGKPSARDQQVAAKTPKARETPNKTV